MAPPTIKFNSMPIVLMRMSLNGLRSHNSGEMCVGRTKPSQAKNPSDAPLLAECASSMLTANPRTQNVIRVKMSCTIYDRVMPRVLAPTISFSVRLVSVIHSFPNNSGEYQIDPMANATIDATMIDQTLIDSMIHKQLG